MGEKEGPCEEEEEGREFRGKDFQNEGHEEVGANQLYRDRQ
jgi:hypothetical protein